ncbi:MAG: non-ribosomal peptide synthetase [Caulobacterales bacterium]
MQSDAASRVLYLNDRLFLATGRKFLLHEVFFMRRARFTEESLPPESATYDGRGGLAYAFRVTVAEHAYAPALVQRGRPSWTYRDLDLASDRAATNLRQHGVQPGDRVALIAARSQETIAAILGIVKIGAIYVPIDPAYPATQIAHMLRDAAATLLLTDDAPPACVRVESVAQLTLARVLQVSPDLAFNPPAFFAAPDQPLYIMYTSGSTGLPKGVVVPHRAVERLVLQQDFCELSSRDVILHASPLAFDASTFEIWGALLNGGALAILNNARPSVTEIGAIIDGHKVTIAWLTAGLFHLVVDHAIESLSPLRQLLAGGDVLSPSHVDRVLRRFPACRVINGYGPTENTTFTCCHTFMRGPLEAAPIGRAIAGTEVFVLDEDRLPVLDGASGELAAGGAGLALGYHNLPELTAARFVTLPAPINQRVYLTGDIVRRRPDGVIEFLGRLDGQVKIGGKRVEPGEIEAALRADERVADSAVIAIERGAAGKQLFAFVTSRLAGPPAHWEQNLLPRLHETLPAHMIPASISAISALPLTANGKVDRAALAEFLVAGDCQSSSLETTPSSDLESKLVAIWESVLGVSIRRLDLNFFDLGGRSLQLMQAHAETQRVLDRDFPFAAMFEHASISDLAAYLRGAQSQEADSSIARTRADRARDAAARARLARGK